MCYTEACLNLNFEALHKLMFNETVCLEVFAVLSNWLNANASRGSFISPKASLLSYSVYSPSLHSQAVFSTVVFCTYLPGLQKICLPPPPRKKQRRTEDPTGLIVQKTCF